MPSTPVLRILAAGAALALATSAWAQLPAPTNLRATPFYTTAYVQWNVVSDPSVAGYHVYRRTATGSYPASPTKRVLVRGEFSDYNLTPGQTYFYKVVAINGAGTAISEYTPEISTTLRTSSATLSTHKTLEMLVVVYTGGYTQTQADALVNGLKEGVKFYWRTTCGVLSIDATYLYIDTYPPGDSWYSSAVQNDLRARGVQDGQYDLGYLIGNNLAGCYGGYYVFGGMCASLGTVCGVPYPAIATPALDLTIIWTFTHEIHHALELMENVTGAVTPEVLFCHFSDAYPNDIGANGWHMPLGPHFGGIAATNRDYGDKWFLFPAPYDSYIECVDADEDGFPDTDRRVPLSEVRFRSNATLVDTDDDGLTDLDELCAYNFRSLDPRVADTDGDGIPDGDDPYPLYVVSDGIPYANTPPVIDGTLDASWERFSTGYYFSQDTLYPLATYWSWDEDALYVAIESSRQQRFMISLLGKPEWGRWASDVRHVEGDPSTTSNSNDVNNIGDVWADGRYIYTYYGADEVWVHGRSAIAGAEVASGGSAGTFVTEIKIPRVLPGGATHVWYMNLDAPVVDGLRLEEGRRIGINLSTSNIAGSDSNEYSGTWTGLFETHSYEAFELLPASQCADVNCDGAVDTGDIDAFVQALVDPAGYAAAYPGCNILNADANGDGVVDTADIDLFVAAIISGGCQ
jgi:hypothetical protein